MNKLLCDAIREETIRYIHINRQISWCHILKECSVIMDRCLCRVWKSCQSYKSFVKQIKLMMIGGVCFVPDNITNNQIGIHHGKNKKVYKQETFMKHCSLTQRVFFFLNADLSSISSGMKTYTRRCINNIVIINPAWLTFYYPSLQSHKILGNK